MIGKKSTTAKQYLPKSIYSFSVFIQNKSPKKAVPLDLNLHYHYRGDMNQLLSLFLTIVQTVLPVSDYEKIITFIVMIEVDNMN